MKNSIYYLLFILLFLFSCNLEDKNNNANQDGYNYTEALNDTILQIEIQEYGKTKINDSLNYCYGYGSSLVKHPTKKYYFYMLTDRGPNFDILPEKTNLKYDFEIEEGKKYQTFADTNFTPQIGLFYFDGKQFKLIESIALKNQKGINLTGITSTKMTNEIPVYIKDSKLIKLKRSDNGIDSEGIVACADGSFWISDEYEPAIFHFDKNGKMLHEKINPNTNVLYKGVNLKLPKVFSKRKVNAGLEGVTATNNDSVLFCVVQKPLVNYKNDKKLIKGCRYIRICKLDLYSGELKEFVYITEHKKNYISEIRSLTDSTFLIIERDGKNPIENKESDKLICKIKINDNTTNINSNGDNEFGMLFSGKTLEELTFHELDSINVVSVEKEVIMNIPEVKPDFFHRKVEGIEFLDNNIFFVNDNDFAIDYDYDKNAILETKNQDVLDKCYIYIYLPNEN